MGDAPDFISSFHNLEGDLIGERKKSLYKLIINPSLFSNEQQRNDALEKLQPKTYQEGLFYIDALIYFKRTEKLYEILKGGNQMFATKILKQPWFFEKAFKNIEAEKLVNEFLPHFSYVVRKKLLTRVSRCWPQNKVDTLFDALNNKYGLAAATPILQKCSSDKIKLVLEENEIKLRPNQVIELFNKGEGILKFYLDYFKMITKSTYDETKVVKYISLKNPNFLLELQKSEKLYVQSIGRRTTKKIVKISKDLSKDCERYIKFLKKAVLVKKLGSEFKTVYKQIFPKSFLNVSNFCVTDDLLEKYPKKGRWQLFYQTCTEIFENKSDRDILLILDNRIKNFEPPQEILHKWAEIQYEKQESNYEDYLKYYPTFKAIDIVKEKINITSDIKRRSNLLDLLINICAENKDLAALEKVLEYISARHKNEPADTREHLLRLIQDRFNMDDLKEVHWKYINEQLTILKIHKDCTFYYLSNIYDHYLKFLVKSGKDTKEGLMSYWKDLVTDSFYRDLEVKDVSIEQQIYTEFCKIFPEIVSKESEKWREKYNSFIVKVISFSVSNPKHCINLIEFPHFVSMVLSTFNKEHKLENQGLELVPKVIIYNNTFPQYAFPIENSTVFDVFLVGLQEQDSIWWFVEVLTQVVAKKDRTDFANELLIFYFKNAYEKYPDRELVPWLLKNEPKTVIPYFDTIIKNNVKDSYSYTLENKILKHYSHLDLDRRVKEYCLQQLDEIDKTDTTKLSSCVQAVYPLLTIEEFIKLVEERFLPKKDKLDLEDKEMRDLYKIQCDLAKKLGRVDEPYKMLPTIMKFARGDYLQSTLPALYCAFYKSPERILYSYVEQLSKQAVSSRKHAIFLSCEVLDKEHTLNMLNTTNQKNVSSQKHLFSATLKYFLKNPSQDLLEKVTESMNTIDKNDTETLESLKDVNVPTKYRTQYIEKCWYFYESLQASNIKIDDYLAKLVEHMSQDILTTLPTGFLTYIIKKYFASFRISCFEDFVIKALKDRSDHVENFELVFGLLIKLNANLTNKFLDAFLRVARDKDVDKSFVFSFTKYWYRHFTIIKTLKAHIALKLVLLKLDNVAIDNYAHSVVKYMEELIAEFSFLVFSVFKEQVDGILSSLSEEDKYKFYLAALQYKADANTCVLVLELMSSVHEDDRKELWDIYKSILDVLKTVDIPIVIAYYKSFLANVESE